MSQKIFLGANWKMNDLPVGCCTPESPYRSTDNVEICVFPTFIDLHVTHIHGLMTGAQWGCSLDHGARTGDISLKLLANQKVDAVLCGHSERRQHYREADEEISKQFFRALELGILPILCIGETADEHEMGETEEVLARQLSIILTHTSHLTPQNFLIAYEPVWAIGTGKTPTPAEANETHGFIRSLLTEKKTRILYGGSMTSKNAAELLAQPNIDGGLIGGASLKPDEFRMIVEAAKKIKS